jgi:hypothetical protein
MKGNSSGGVKEKRVAGPKPATRKEEPDSFQAKLLALKKKFKD